MDDFRIEGQVKRTVHPDGRVVEKYSDGTVINRNPDGTVIQKLPDGTMIKTRPDGSRVVKRAQAKAEAPQPKRQEAPQPKRPETQQRQRPEAPQRKRTEEPRRRPETPQRKKTEEPRRRTEEPRRRPEPAAPRKKPSAQSKGTSTKKRKKKKSLFRRLTRHLRGSRLLIFLGVCVALVGVAVFLLIQANSVYGTIHVEVGVETDVTDFLRFKFKNAAFIEDTGNYSYDTPGIYRLRIKNGLFKHSCTLYIEDFTAPVITLKDLNVGAGASVKPEDFIENIEDGSKCEVSYDGELPKLTVPGSTQTVKIKVTDAAGNISRGEAHITIAPVVDTVYVEVGGELPTAYDFTLAGTNPYLQREQEQREQEAENTENTEEGDETTPAQEEIPLEGIPVDTGDSGTILTDLSSLDLGKPGIYEVKIGYAGGEYTSKICIVDTVPPKFEVRNINGALNTIYEPSDFVISHEDATYVHYDFEAEPDPTSTERQVVVIIGTDEGGNQSRKWATLILSEDHEAPVFVSAEDFEVGVGSTVAYRQMVHVTDNSGKYDLSVDSSAVDINTEGTYTVSYVATDANGNSANKTVNVNVVQRTANEQELFDRVDLILNEILTPDMTQTDKAWAIYLYIAQHVSYVDSSEKGDYVASALYALDNACGDCYVYFSLAKVMLTRAGITNMDIARIPEGNDEHYWNLVDVDDGHGWYHFDTTPRWDHPTVFLWTDDQAKQYSAVNQNCYNYDPALYPEIP